ncbi:MAG: phosphoribosylglycinamide formyltransferase [Planctomycetota bacterium]
MTQGIRLYTDGASRGNPGPAAGGFVIVGQDNKQLEAKAFFLGTTTNNVAEYTAVLKGLEAASRLGTCEILILSDSELMVRQLMGRYRVKNQNLKTLHAQCLSLLADFEKWDIRYIPREENNEADSLVNRALNLGRDVQADLKAVPKDKGGRKIRLGMLISGGGRTVLNIKKEIDAGNLNAEIAIVISSRSAVAGVPRIREAGLDLEIVRRKDYCDTESFSKKLEEVLVSRNVELVVQAGWLCLWRIPEKFQNRVMNIHPALLPSFGGEGMWGHHVHEAVLKHGCKVSGCTVHFCTNEYDKGPIIIQRTCPVLEDDDAESLAARVFEQECIAYPEAIRLFSEDRITVHNNHAGIRR